jgi:threonine dehydratase
VFDPAPPWPIPLDAVYAARARIATWVSPTPLFRYPLLDEWIGHGIQVVVKHENFNPTNSFKVRNGLSFMTALPQAERARGVVAATRGNHGLGIAFASRIFGVKATICVPVGNNPDKNAGMRALGAIVIENGRDYDASLVVAEQVVREEGATLAHSTNDRAVLAGAATMSLEMVEQDPALDAVVIAVGGGSQAVGALTVARELKPQLEVYGVQAEGAAAAHDSWHAGRMVTTDRADTFADGLATRSAYALTFRTLQEGLADFVTVSDTEIAESLRALLRFTHSMVEGAGATGLAGLRRLAPRLANRRVGVVISGGNIDDATLLRVLQRAI